MGTRPRCDKSVLRFVGGCGIKEMSSCCDVSCLRQDAERLAGTWRIPYIECSSLTGENVAEVFHTLMKEVEKGDGLLAERGQGGCLVQ